ncbi:MAG: hypothetical protein QM606_05080 [Leucobacter sp.]
MSFPGGLTISNFVLPNGKRAYCIEVSMDEPSGYSDAGSIVRELPGRAGRFSSWGDVEGMRRMNYLIDRYGQTGDAWTSAAVQLTIWRIRENFGGGNAHLNRKIATLKGSALGRELIAASNRLFADAKQGAKAPVAPKAVTGALSLEDDPNGKPRRYRLAYPKGTTSLTARGGLFVRNGASKIAVDPAEASARYIDLTAGAKELSVEGSWISKGVRGWKPELEVFDTAVSSGGVAQRLAVAVGSSTATDLTGAFARVVKDVREWAAPTASSLAQPSAELGGTMTDTLIVTSPKDKELEMWPEATAEFTAYLLPEAGAPKYDGSWQPVLGEPYDAQAEDPATGEALWQEWWAASDGSALLDASGAKIPVSDRDGNPTSGLSADGTPYPVQRLGEDGEPVIGADGAPVHLIGRDPVIEERRDPVRWSAEEIEGMTGSDLCTAQPVYREQGIPVPGVGRFTTKPVTVRSAGTVHWVERVVSRGKTVHEGKCGIANETTRIGQPGVETQAIGEAVIGDELYDVATISGTLSAGGRYALRFEAYRAPEPFDAQAEPVCDAGNIVFRSADIGVTGVGQVRSPGFSARWEHGTVIWWVETLLVDTGDGLRAVHRGECGLENETTRIIRPTVETSAQPRAVAGDPISDVALVSKGAVSRDGVRWEVDFRGYREAYEPVDAGETESSPDGSSPQRAVCAAENLLFETGAVAVEGPGEVRSEDVATSPDWAGAVWWVERLWLLQGEERILVHTGECGLDNETTRVSVPEVVTRALGSAAVGDLVHDTATVSGELSDLEGVEYEVVFEGYRGDPRLTGTEEAECTEENHLFSMDPVGFSEPGEVVSPGVTALPEYGETIWWVETLLRRDRSAGNDRGAAEPVELHRGRCGMPDETTTVQYPEVRTESAGTVAVGDEMYDTAIVSGPISGRDDIEFRVTFTAYGRPASGEMSCEPESEIAALRDAEGVVVDGPGRYESRRVRVGEEHAGLGGYVERLVLIENGTEHLVHEGGCGASSENLEVVRRHPSNPPGRRLATTGGAQAMPVLIGGVAMLILGTAAWAIALRRRSGASRIRDCGDIAERAE